MKQADGQKMVLGKTEVEKDLGVHVANTLKPTTHCHRAANKGMSALKLMRIAFDCQNEQNFKVLFTTYVCPHLDYCAQAVRSYMKQDFVAIEKYRDKLQNW